MKTILTIIALLVAVGCTPKQQDTTAPAQPIGNVIVCALQDTIVTAVAAEASKLLVCSNVDAMKASLLEQVKKADVCKQPTTGVASTSMKAESVLGSMLCPSLSDSLVESLFKTNVPASWGCTGGAPLDKVKDMVLQSCLKSM